MPPQVSGQQLAILRVLWELGSASVADVQKALEAEHSLAYSTVATVLARMERKGLVTHRQSGRVFYYEPVLALQKVSRSLLSDLVERVFEGSPSLLVSQLLDGQAVGSDELKRIKSLIVRHEQAQAQGEAEQSDDDHD